MSMDNRVDLRALMQSLQSQLAAGLQARDVLEHPEAKGTASELDWKGMLTRYLPLRYQVNKAFVIDSVGNRSHQIDIVIHDRQYSPLLFEHAGAIYVPAESVYGIIEVKQRIGKQELAYASAKTRSVRQLQRTSVTIPHAGGRYHPKAPFEIFSGVVALDAGWKTRVAERLRHALATFPPGERLDIGCIMHHGGFHATYSKRGKCRLEISRSEVSLGYFLLRLLSQLQRLGTVPALDLDAYSESLVQRTGKQPR